MANIDIVGGIGYLRDKGRIVELTQAEIDILDVNLALSFIKNTDTNKLYMAKGNGIRVVFTVINLAYSFHKTKDILDIGTAWEAVNNITISSTIDTVYELKLSVEGFMGDTNDEARLRYRIDGGDWYEIIKEAKDPQQTFNISYFLPYTAVNNTIIFELEASKEVNGDIFDIYFSNLIIQETISTDIPFILLSDLDFDNALPSSFTTTIDPTKPTDLWEIGTYDSPSGNSLFNSRDGGVTGLYNHDVTIHAYYDIDVPLGLYDIVLQMLVKCIAEENYDGYRIFACDTSIIPIGGTELIHNGTTINEITLDIESGISTHTIKRYIVPSKYENSTVRIVIQFTSDGSVNGFDGVNINTLIIKAR